MEKEKKMEGKYGNRYGIFTDRVKDVKALHDVILKEFLPCLTQMNFWFSAWCVLKDNGCLDMGKDRADFGRQMMDWYGSAYSINCLDVYATTCLARSKWQDWADEAEISFPEFMDRESAAIERRRVSIRTVRKMYFLCKRFNPLIEQCIKTNK